MYLFMLGVGIKFRKTYTLFFWELTNDTLLFKKEYYTVFLAQEYMVIKSHLNITSFTTEKMNFQS